MNAVKAQVKNGRLLVDEPTDLPDGNVIYLEPVAGEDEETAGERAAIEAAIHEGPAIPWSCRTVKRGKLHRRSSSKKATQVEQIRLCLREAVFQEV